MRKIKEIAICILLFCLLTYSQSMTAKVQYNFYRFYDLGYETTNYYPGENFTITFECTGSQMDHYEARFTIYGDTIDCYLTYQLNEGEEVNPDWDYGFEDSNIFWVEPGHLQNGSNSMLFKINNHLFTQTEDQNNFNYWIEEDSYIEIGDENAPLNRESMITEYINNGNNFLEEWGGFLLLGGIIGGGIAVGYVYIKRKDEYIYLTTETDN